MESKSSDIISRISKLPSDQALVFKLKTFHNISTQVIADKMSIEASSVWQLLHQARVTLMQ